MEIKNIILAKIKYWEPIYLEKMEKSVEKKVLHIHSLIRNYEFSSAHIEFIKIVTSLNEKRELILLREKYKQINSLHRQGRLNYNRYILQITGLKFSYLELLNKIISDYNKAHPEDQIKIRYQKPIIKNSSLVHVNIWIPDQQISLDISESLVIACGEFMESMGFELKREDEPVLGSFWKKLFFKFNKEKAKKEIDEVYEDGKKALKEKYLYAPSADNAEKLATAAANLMKALEPVEQGVIRLGRIMVVKALKDGKTTIIAETISPELANQLDAEPKLLKDPVAMFDLLSKGQPTLLEGEA